MLQGVIFIDKYLIYLRKSHLDRDDTENTLLRHETKLNEFCKKEKLNVVKTYKEVVSGGTLTERPQMCAMLKDIEQNNYKGVVCMDIDRLSRGDSYDSGYIIRVLQINNCKIITPAKTYDLNDLSDNQFTDLKFLFARYELKTITNRLKNGKIASVKEGKYIGTIAPYGYERVKLQGKGYTLKIVKSESEIVKLIFDLRQKGLGYGSIAQYLSEHNILLRGKAPTKSTIYNIANNVIYTGKTFSTRHTQNKSIKNGELVTSRKRVYDYELYDGLHDAIISDDVFYSVVDVAPVQRKRELRNPFASLLYCKKCHKPLIRNVSNKTACYHCISSCDCKGIKCDTLENAILEKMKIWLNDYEINIKPTAHTNIDYDAVINDYDMQIMKLKTQQSKLCELLENDIYTIEMFQNRNSVIQKQIDDLNNAKHSSKTLKFEQQDHIQRLDDTLQGAHKILSSYDVLDVFHKNRLWKQILEKIEYYRCDDDIEITLYPRL